MGKQRIIYILGENDRGRTDHCAKHIEGRTDPVRTDGFEYVEGANGPFTIWKHRYYYLTVHGKTTECKQS